MAGDLVSRRTLLAARIRWTDRLRRPVSIAFAAIVAPLSLYQLRQVLEADWPLIPVILPCLLWASLIWWSIEAGFAFAIALWETEHDRLSRAIGLPPARLVRRGRRSRPPE